MVWLGFGHANGMTFREVQLELVVHPGIPHQAFGNPVYTNSVPYAGGLTVSSDASWVIPQWNAERREILLQFVKTNLFSPATATVRAESPGETNEFYVHANVVAPNVARMLTDPSRPKVYALHQSGVDQGSLIVVDPKTGRPVESRTLGHRPTDLRIDPSTDELLILHSVDKNVWVLGLPDLGVRQTIVLPEFQNWGADSTDANLGLGPGNVLYYTDGQWAPVLYVLDRASGSILQRVGIDSNGFGGFAVSPDRKSLVGWAQYGWSAGWAGSYLARFDIAENGTLIHREQTDGQWPTILQRDPLDSPVLFDQSGARVFAKQVVVDAAAIKTTLRSFPRVVYAISPNGELACSPPELYRTSTGNSLHSLPGSAILPVITPDYSRLVYFDSTEKNFKSIDLVQAVGTANLGLDLDPDDGAVITPPERLRWLPVTGASAYRVYWGTNQDAVRVATPDSPEYLGEARLPEWSRQLTAIAGTRYYWRIDALVDGVPVAGDVLSYTVSPLSISVTHLKGTAIGGFASELASFDLNSESPGLSWEISSPEAWISFSTNRGVTPARIRVVVDASRLPVGTQSATIQVGTSEGTVARLPVLVRVAPLTVTQLQSDPGSAFVYAISEDSQDPSVKAQLLEINTETQTLTRKVDVGSSVTDLAIHPADGRIYVPNWRIGTLLAVNRTTFEVERSYGFKAFGGIGYGGGDVYRVSAGVAGRLVVEEADQWINIHLFDTAAGNVIHSTNVREGGGRFGTGGRYYYHGENNSSGATIQRYDVSGNTFSLLTSIRVESASYYGSRVVTVSEDGSRVFWNGSVFDEALKELWTFGEHVYSCTPDGRFAFAYERIYDTHRRVQVLQMPAPTTVSTYNSTSKKLVAQVGPTLRFYTLDPSALSLTTPKLTAASILPNGISLAWTDASLEMAFVLQMRMLGAEAWTDLATLTANTVLHEVPNLLSGRGYQFRVRATALNLSSEWSEVLTVTTPGFPPDSPILSPPVATFRGIRLEWSASTGATGLILERRTNDAPWLLLPIPADTTSYDDSDVIQGGQYQYRITATNAWGASAPSLTVPILVPYPTPPIAPNPPSLDMLPGLSIRISWEPVSDAESYDLEFLPSGQVDWRPLAATDRHTTSYTNQVVILGGTYGYRVVAVNAYGRSNPSTPRTIVATKVVPLLEDGFESGPSHGVWDSVSGAETRLGPDPTDSHILWFGLGEARSAITIPFPSREGSILEFSLRVGPPATTNEWWDPVEPGKGLIIEASSNGAQWRVLENLELAALTTANSWSRRSYRLPVQVTGDATRVRIRQPVHSGQGKDTWALDSWMIQGPIVAAPLPPSWLITTPSASTSVDLVWERVSVATVYGVERFEGEAGWVNRATVPAAEPWYRDDQCIPGTTYRYRVRAMLGTEPSAPSPAVYGNTLSQIVEWMIEQTGRATEPPTSLTDSQWSRFAFGLDWDAPAHHYDPASSRPGLPVIQVETPAGRFDIRFMRRKASMNPGVRYLPEISSDLATWRPCAEPVHVESINELWELVRIVEPGTSDRHRFCRVRVVIAE